MNGNQPFFWSRWVHPPPGVEELDDAQLAPGFKAATARCGLKKHHETDIGLLVCESEDVISSMLLTRNASAAAPVRVCRDRCEKNGIRAVVVNSGNANAETGAKGYEDAVAMCDEAASQLELRPESVAVAETGVIGVPLPIDAVLEGIREAADNLSASASEDFARAIRTTDQWTKRCTLRAGGVTLSAQAKGGGMIRPNMATMLCFVQTDAVVEDPDAKLREATDASFERITVDGQMSTNDTVILQATGASGLPLPDGLLEAVLLQMAVEVIFDGEGSKRIGRIQVDESASIEEANRVARAIANSPLVKTALHGSDANWGRIAQAAGMALAGEMIEEFGVESIDYEELGATTPEAEIGIRLGRGTCSTHVWFADLGHEYVTVNAEYTT
jgi:glutamate N-acetyltransferase/amino-acid N-acetyltransferase